MVFSLLAGRHQRVNKVTDLFKMRLRLLTYYFRSPKGSHKIFSRQCLDNPIRLLSMLVSTLLMLTICGKILWNCCMHNTCMGLYRNLTQFPLTAIRLNKNIVTAHTDYLFLTWAVFSLNFSSAGKGPFMDGKAKNIYFSKRGGGGAVEWGTWTRPHWEIFYSHILRPILRKSAVVIFRKQIKTFDSNNFTMSPKCMSLKRKAAYTVLVQNQNNARAKSGVRSCCAARTCKPPQEVKVPYFCGPFVVYPQELWNERSQKSSPQEARKLP